MFFESGDVDGLATQMAAVIGGGGAEKLAAAGHAKMLREYTWKKVADDLEGIYRGAEERAGS